MKTFPVAVAAFLALALTTLNSFAAGGYVIKQVTPALVPTPAYNFTGTDRRSGRAEQWLEVEVTFESDVEWSDELTFKYYILIGGKCLTGEVTHVNIPKGRDLHSVMYISPRTLLRVLNGKQATATSIENVGVQILKQGALMDTKSSKPTPQPQWWQNMQQTPGLVLNKNETPFAPLFWDRYEAIKSATR